MVALINVERVKAGLGEVVLGDNIAAQLHAESSLDNCVSSHWGMDGLKPYMRYSLAGGQQYEAENIRGLGYCIVASDGYRKSESIRKEVHDAVRGLMGSSGHRRNILNPAHQKVNVGLAWDHYNTIVVQQFEGDYVSYAELPGIADGILKLTGTLRNGARWISDGSVSLQVFYDRPPQSLTRGQLSRTYCYDSGREIASVLSPLTGGWNYATSTYSAAAGTKCTSPYAFSPTLPGPTSATEAQAFWQRAYDEFALTPTVFGSSGGETASWIVASLWSIDSPTFDIQADVSDLLDKWGEGVYTVMLWAELGGKATRVSSYSIFHEVEPPATYSSFAQASESHEQ